MDEHVHWLVVVRSVENKLLPKIKESSLAHLDSVFLWILALDTKIFSYQNKFLISQNKVGVIVNCTTMRTTHSAHPANSRSGTDIFFTQVRKSENKKSQEPERDSFMIVGARRW